MGVIAAASIVALILALVSPILIAAGYLGAYRGVADEENARELRQRLFFGTQFAWDLVPRWCGLAIVAGAVCGLLAIVVFLGFVVTAVPWGGS